jgi:hypothetical protein
MTRSPQVFTDMTTSMSWFDLPEFGGPKSLSKPQGEICRGHNEPWDLESQVSDPKPVPGTDESVELGAQRVEPKPLCGEVSNKVDFEVPDKDGYEGCEVPGQEVVVDPDPDQNVFDLRYGL